MLFGEVSLLLFCVGEAVICETAAGNSRCEWAVLSELRADVVGGARTHPAMPQSSSCEDDVHIEDAEVKMW